MPTRTGAKKTTFGADLIEGMKLVLAHQRGKVDLEQRQHLLRFEPGQKLRQIIPVSRDRIGRHPALSGQVLLKGHIIRPGMRRRSLRIGLDGTFARGHRMGLRRKR